MNMTVCPRCGCPSFGPRCRRCSGSLAIAGTSGLFGLNGGLEGRKKKKAASGGGGGAVPATRSAKKGLPMWATALIAFGGILLIGGGLYWLKTRKRRK